MHKTIFLIGFMGSGKTTVGKKLAKQLNKKFVDLDQLMVQQVGMSIPAYFEQYGEEKFRLLERDSLRQLSDTDCLVSTGGGSPCYFDNMAFMLAHGLVIYLSLTPKALWSRLQHSNIESRPALKGLQNEELLAFIESKLTDREPFYSQAHLAIDQLQTPVENIVDIIATYQK